MTLAAKAMWGDEPDRDRSDDETVRAILNALSESAAAFCVSDDADRIRYANATFRTAFFPQFDGRPTDFVEAIAEAIANGTGIRLTSTTLDNFIVATRRRRRALEGSLSFATDMTNGGWWSVTDTKLSNGWTLAIAQDISRLKSEEARLRDAHESALAEARTDFLTGAPNRRHGLRSAETLWKTAMAAGSALSLALLDVDHFKSINDAYGHEAGDRALIHFARQMARAIGPDDQFSRLGGDEFMLVRPGASGRALDRALAKILKAIPPMDLDGTPERLRLSISAGVADARPGDTWPGLMHRADIALYDAKAGGRQRVALSRS